MLNMQGLIPDKHTGSWDYIVENKEDQRDKLRFTMDKYALMHS